MKLRSLPSRTYAQEYRHFTRAVDALWMGVLICDVCGRVMHANSAALRTLADLRIRAVVFREAERLALSCCRACGHDGSNTDCSEFIVERDVTYRLRANYVGVGVMGATTAVLVTLEAVEAAAQAPARPCFPAVLTDRERAVAELLAHGRSNAEIAHALHISNHTARHHCGRVLAKMGVRSRAAVGSVLFRHQESR